MKISHPSNFDPASAFPQLSFLLDQIGGPQGTIYISSNPSDNDIELNIISNVNTTFSPGVLVEPENAPGSTGSLFYLDLTSLGITAAELETLAPVANGWTFQTYADELTIGLTPVNSVTVAANTPIPIKLTGFSVANPPQTTTVTLMTTYFRINGITIGDLGFPTSMIESLLNPPSGKADLHQAVSVSVEQNEVLLSNGKFANVINSLSLVFSPGSQPTPVPAGKDTVFELAFVYGPDTDFGCLTTNALGRTINPVRGVNATQWGLDDGTEQNNPSWLLIPPSGENIVATNSTVQFDINRIVSYSKSGATVLLLTYKNVPGYTDGSYIVPLVKVPHVTIESFTVTPTESVLQNGSAAVVLSWKVLGATALSVNNFTDVTSLPNLQVPITVTTPFTLQATGPGQGNLDNIDFANVTAEVYPLINSFVGVPSDIFASDFPKEVQLSWNVDTNETVQLTSSATGPDPSMYSGIGTVGKSINAPQKLMLTPNNAPPDDPVSRGLIISAFNPQSSNTSFSGANSVVMPPNASFLAVTTSTSEVQFLSTATFAPFASVTVGAGACGLSYSADGSQIFVANSKDGTVSVIKVTHSESTPPYTFAVLSTLTTGGTPIATQVSPDGNYLYVLETSGPSLFILKRGTYGSFALDTTLPVGSNPTDIAVTPSGIQIFVSCVGDNTIRMIGNYDGVFQESQIVNTPAPNSLAVTRDGKLLLVACVNSSQVLGIQTESPQSPVRTVYKLRENPRQVRVLPTGDYALVTTASNQVALISTANDSTEVFENVAQIGSPTSLAVSPEGALASVASSNGALTVLTLAQYETSGYPLACAPVTDVAIAPGDTEVAAWYNSAIYMSTIKNPGTGAYVLDVASSVIIQRLAGIAMTGFVYSQGAGDKTAFVSQAASNAIEVISTDTWKSTTSIAIPAKGVYANRLPTLLAGSGDGSQLFALVHDGSLAYSVVIFDCDPVNGQYTLNSDLSVFTLSGNSSKYLCAHADGSAAYAIDSIDAKLWTISRNASGRYVIDDTPTKVGTAPAGVALRPDGSSIYILDQVGMSNAVIKVDTTTMATTTEYLVDGVSAVSPNGLTVSPDGSKLLVTDGVAAGIRVIDATSLRFLQTLSPSPDVEYPMGIVMSSDGAHLYTANANSGNIGILQQVQPVNSMARSRGIRAAVKPVLARRIESGTMTINATQPTWKQIIDITGPPNGGICTVGIECNSLMCSGTVSFEVPGPDPANTINFSSTVLRWPSETFSVRVTYPPNFETKMILDYAVDPANPAPQGATITAFLEIAPDDALCATDVGDSPASYQGIFVRDELGQVPGQVSNVFSTSPDIILYGVQPVQDNPAAYFATAASYATDYGSNVYLQQANYVYVRGLNTAAAEIDGRAWLYCVESDLVMWPQNWSASAITVNGNPQNYLSLTTEAGAVGAAGTPFIFMPSPPNPNTHYCMVLIVENIPSDPPASPTQSMGFFKTYAELVSYVLNTPYLGWRNTNDIVGSPPTWTQVINITGAPAGGQCNVGIQCNEFMTSGTVSFTVQGSCPDNTINFPSTVLRTASQEFSIKVTYPPGFVTQMILNYTMDPSNPPQSGANIQPTLAIDSSSVIEHRQRNGEDTSIVKKHSFVSKVFESPEMLKLTPTVVTRVGCVAFQYP